MKNKLIFIKNKYQVYIIKTDCFEIVKIADDFIRMKKNSLMKKKKRLYSDLNLLSKK